MASPVRRSRATSRRPCRTTGAAVTFGAPAHERRSWIPGGHSAWRPHSSRGRLRDRAPRSSPRSPSPGRTRASARRRLGDLERGGRCGRPGDRSRGRGPRDGRAHATGRRPPSPGRPSDRKRARDRRRDRRHPGRTSKGSGTTRLESRTSSPDPCFPPPYPSASASHACASPRVWRTSVSTTTESWTCRPIRRTPAGTSWGPSPGALGPAVVAGHVTWNQAPAVFFRLAELRPGDVVQVTRTDGVVAVFEVTRVERYPQVRVPDRTRSSAPSTTRGSGSSPAGATTSRPPTGTATTWSHSRGSRAGTRHSSSSVRSFDVVPVAGSTSRSRYSPRPSSTYAWKLPVCLGDHRQGEVLPPARHPELDAQRRGGRHPVVGARDRDRLVGPAEEDPLRRLDADGRGGRRRGRRRGRRSRARRRGGRRGRRRRRHRRWTGVRDPS